MWWIAPQIKRWARCAARDLRSLLRDEWEVLDVNDNVIGKLFEDSMGLAMLRRLLLGSLLPQNYDITLGETRVADLKQRFNLFRYELDLDFSMDTGHQLGSPPRDCRRDSACRRGRQTE